MSTVVVVGTQWGDEGKGKITDYLAERADVIARYQGGNNAGHTIMVQNEKYKLTLIPSGIFYSQKTCVIGNGLVLNPQALLEEISYVQSKGFSTENLKISDRAHIIMPYHLLLDEWEEQRRGSNQIGTTRKGIGPAYVDKASRTGIRMGDLINEKTFETKLRAILAEKNTWIEKLYGKPALDVEPILTQYRTYATQLRPYVTDTSYVLNEAIDAKKHVLFEGAQGVMLDVDHGTYPFVTSSNPSAGGVCTGVGVGPTKIDHVIGVAKAYTTRVGDGPFPTEMHDDIGHTIRERGHEYGTVTGRPRRIGWFDTVVVRHSRRVSGITGLSLNSLDVLSGLKHVNICTHYVYNGQKIEQYPADLTVLAQCTPMYETLPGWEEDITHVRTLEALPPAAKQYVARIAELSQIPIAIFSVGRNREQTNLVQPIYET